MTGQPGQPGLRRQQPRSCPEALETRQKSWINTLLTKWDSVHTVFTVAVQGIRGQVTLLCDDCNAGVWVARAPGQPECGSKRICSCTRVPRLYGLVWNFTLEPVFLLLNDTVTHEWGGCEGSTKHNMKRTKCFQVLRKSTLHVGLLTTPG